jgi:hypothetical protein
MDYAILLQQIIDDLKTDREVNPKWRNLVVAQLERLQPWCLMLYDTPDFHQPLPNVDEYDDTQDAGTPGDISEIPEAFRDIADPRRINNRPSDQPLI